jgi:hypothetical protein
MTLLPRLGWSLSAALASFTLLRPPAEPSTAPPAEPRGGLVTLYARDDLACALDLRGGRVGAALSQGEIDLRNAQLVYGAFEPGLLSFGFDDRERVAVLDLGDVYVPPQERAADRTVEYPVALFHTLFVDGSRFFYQGPGRSLHRFDDADRILGSFPPEGLAHVKPQVGHTYVLRAKRDGVGGTDLLFKLHVVAHRPGESLTLRWAPVG